MPNHITSLDFRLFNFWVGMPPGRGVTMAEMASGMETGDPQAIRSSLTRLRQGRVVNPADRTEYLRPLPVRWNPADRLYYDLSNLPPAAVAAQIPGNILTGAVSQLLARVNTLQSSMGQDGLVRSAQSLLADNDIRGLLLQIPIEDIWRVQDRLQTIGRARELLELQSGSTPLPMPEYTDPEEDEDGN